MVDKQNLQSGSIEHINSVMDETDKVEYEYDGHYYWFEFETNLDWSTKVQLVIENLQDTTLAELEGLDNVPAEDIDMAGLYISLIREQVVDSNIDKMNVFLQRIPDDFGDSIAEDIADTVGLFEDDSGNLKKL